MDIAKWKIIIISFVVFSIIIIGFIIITEKKQSHKGTIIKNFNKNYQTFNDVSKYFNEQNKIISVYKENDKIIFKFDESNNSIDNSSIKKQAEYIINRLHFESITKSSSPALKQIILFSKSTGGLEEGILYSKDDIGKYGMEMIKLRDCWYYYANGNV